VFEVRKVKGRGDRESQRGRRQGRVRLEHTSLPITSLARHRRTEELIGVHFFSPVEKMMLVEIIMGEKTANPGARGRARLRARDPQDADRGERLARFYTSRVGRHYIAKAT
jgi:3-hydroxyacyl-CoA dehydrogenase/enoyl-CoA hydratase/3-hydroxybutyryl-CoA epimerase